MKNNVSVLLINENHSYSREIIHMAEAFFGKQNVFSDKDEIKRFHLICKSYLEENFAVFEVNGKTYTEKASPENPKRALLRTAYKGISEHTGIILPWGILMGIRPTKIVFDNWSKGKSDSEIFDIMQKEYLLSSEKALLCLEVANAEKEIVLSARKNKVSVYIGIPFCPSRCNYCSFSSFPIGKYISNGIAEKYVEILCKEIKDIETKIKSNNLEVESVYIGGGTPTSLAIGLFAKLLDSVSEIAKSANEFTVEAGRPDTIDIDKLRLMRNVGVTRISINPQTLNDKTLSKIGRKHTVQQFEKAFLSAREIGFDNINVDLIIGLEGEDIDDVTKTFEQIKRFEPESITVHALAVKRASGISKEKEFSAHDFEKAKEFSRISQVSCAEMGLSPYYMYRQRDIVGGLENVGYCKEGKHCLYNIQMIEDKQTILSAGASSVTKFVFGEAIERFYNLKGVEEYIARFDEIMTKKNDLFNRWLLEE